MYFKVHEWVIAYHVCMHITIPSESTVKLMIITAPTQNNNNYYYYEWENFFQVGNASITLSIYI